MTFLAALIAFVETPTGQAAVKAIPSLVTDLFSIGAQKGLVTSADIATYLSAQSTFETLCPAKPAVAPVPAA